MLLVEDDLYTIKAMKTMLSRAGYDVMVAETVADGKAALQSDFRVFLLDIMLPDGDGTEVLKLIRERSYSGKVIVTTGTHDPKRLQDVYQYRPDALLIKPLQPPQLIALLA